MWTSPKRFEKLTCASTLARHVEDKEGSQGTNVGIAVELEGGISLNFTRMFLSLFSS